MDDLDATDGALDGAAHGATSAGTAPTTAVVVLAHGSRAEAANRSHHLLCETLAERCGLPVGAAFLELAEPTLAEAVAMRAAAGATTVVVLPLFLHPGRHVVEDMPALLAAARERSPHVDVVEGPMLGRDPGLVDLLAGQVAATVTGSEPSS